MTNGSQAPAVIDQADGRSRAGWRIGVDIGGTFSDIVALGPAGELHVRKVLSRVDGSATGIVEAILQLLDDSNLAPHDIDQVVHATTIATNIIIERRGAKTALVTTSGFRDVLEIGRLRLPEMYNLRYEKPTPLIERALRFEIHGRMNAAGVAIEPLDEGSIAGLGERLVAEDVESIAICLLNSHVNSAHEERLGALLAASVPGVPISLSSAVLPEIREYERTSTTVIDAYVRPAVVRYLDALVSGLGNAGIHAPVFVMQSSGGFMSVEAAKARPVAIVESGPAAGAVGANLVARRRGVANAIAFDMGGTTAKAALIEDGRFRVTTDFEIGGGISVGTAGAAGGGYPIKLPAVDLAEVGAGGGSIVALDRGLSLHVGPRSAGSEPGPVCYGRGGSEVTVTDANLVLGFLSPDGLAGESIPVDLPAARAALDRQIAKPLGLDVLEAAWAVHMLANANMIGAIKAISVQRGRDPRDFVLIAFGGSGPLHAATMANMVGIDHVLVPPAPGLFSAIGLVVADYKHDLVRSFYAPLANVQLHHFAQVLLELETIAVSEAEKEGVPRDRVRLSRSADLRYVGQGFELNVPISSGRVTASTIAELGAAFDAEHTQTYGHASPGAPVQIVNVRVAAIGLPRSERRPSYMAQRGVNRAAGAKRRTYFGDLGVQDARILDRRAIGSSIVAGPAIIEEYDSATVVPPGAVARHDEDGNLLLDLTRAGVHAGHTPVLAAAGT